MYAARSSYFFSIKYYLKKIVIEEKYLDSLIRPKIMSIFVFELLGWIDFMQKILSLKLIGGFYPSNLKRENFQFSYRNIKNK